MIGMLTRSSSIGSDTEGWTRVADDNQSHKQGGMSLWLGSATRVGYPCYGYMLCGRRRIGRGIRRSVRCAAESKNWIKDER